MSRKTIFQVASYFEQELKKQADSYFPNPQNVFNVVESVVDRQKSNPLLSAVLEIVKPLDVQNTIDNTTSVYFQLIVKPEKYDQLMNEPTKTQITNLVKPAVEKALRSTFPSYEFRVTIGIVPALR